MQDSIFISAPPQKSWPLSITMVEARLKEQFPDVRCFREHLEVSDQHYLDFQMTLDGQLRTGVFFDHSYLILKDGPTTLWANTIVWFLSLLPAGTPAVAMVETNPEVVPIPPRADAETIRQLLDSLTP